MIKDIYLAAGCFWGAEHYLKQIKGIVKTEVGYANGNTAYPTYREVYTDNTGYAETVHIQYDTEIIGLERILQLYFHAIDPTSLNKQGEDIGTRYRTGIYYVDSSDLTAINKIYNLVQAEKGQNLAVEVKELKNFYRGEEEHQNYLEKNPQGYCHIPTSLIEFAKTALETSVE